MKKTTFFALVLAFLTVLPAAYAQYTPTPLSEVFGNIWDSIKQLTKQSAYTQDGVITILRFMMLIVLFLAVQAILHKTLGKKGTTEGILKKEAINVISGAAAILTAFLAPIELIIKSVTIILLAFLTVPLIMAVHSAWTKKDEIETIAKVVGLTVFTGLLYWFWLPDLGNLLTALKYMPYETRGGYSTITLLGTFSQWTFIILTALSALLISIRIFKHGEAKAEKTPKTELETATEKEKAQKEAIKVEKKNRDIKISKKVGTAINAIVTLIENLEQIMLTVQNKDVTAFTGQSDNYRRLFAQLVAVEGALQTEPEDKIEIPKKLRTLINKETDLMKIITAANKELTNVIKYFIDNPAQNIVAGTQDQIRGIINKRMIPVLKMLLTINQEETKT